MKKSIQGALIATFALMSGLVYAADVYTEITSTSSVGVYEVGVFIDSKDSINAVQGELVFPEEIMRVIRISDGNSRILFWLEKPYVENNSILFSGVTPGGFSGDKKLIFSFILEQFKQGKGDLVFRNFTVLKNDGEGTLLPVVVTGSELGGADISSGINLQAEDKVAPESFMPYVGRSEDVFEGKSFVVFSTTDKGSGIREYFVKESKYKWFSFIDSWVKTESPHVLQDQDLKSYIFVKAVDESSNERVEMFYPDIRWYENRDSWIIIGVVLVLFYFVWKRKKRHM